MSEVMCAPTLTAAGLADQIEIYIRSHKHNIDPTERWFAAYLGEVNKIAIQIYRDQLHPGYKRLVGEFRLAEIEKERAAKQNEILLLEQEAKVLLGEAKAAA